MLLILDEEIYPRGGVYPKRVSMFAEIGKAIGRSRRTVDSYIADLRAATQMELDLYIFSMNCLRIPQERIATRLGLDQKTIHYHLGKKAALPFSLNTDLRRGCTVSQVSKKHVWAEPLVSNAALVSCSNAERPRRISGQIEGLSWKCEIDAFFIKTA